MVDFTKCQEEINLYQGSEKKKTLIYDNKKYLVKFPDPIREKNKNISYINNAFSEYIGSNIFKLSGFSTQNTILGIYNYNDKDKIVCGCEDFTDENTTLCEFSGIALSTNMEKKNETDIKDIMQVLEIIENIDILNDKNIKEKFWDMFIIDALIGNTDRHNGNWGFLMDKRTKEMIFAPIYDCGSCLNPMVDDREISKLDETEIKNLAVNCYSCLKENNQKINYMSYIKEMKNKECNASILRIFKNINMDKINDFINKISCLSIERKNFYKEILKIRYNILLKTYNKLLG